MERNIYKHKGTFKLESGKELPELEIAYHTFGRLNKDKSNVIWVCHALTANSDVVSWWPGLFGACCLFNPEDYFIVCANIIGSHYGTTSPLSINPKTNSPYYYDFPIYTIRDIVNAHGLLRKHLEIDKINLLIGGSLGGQQVMEWSIIEPDRFDKICLIATDAKFSPWGIAMNETQRMAIENSPDWKIRYPEAGIEGLKTARALALLGYRNYNTYCTTQQDDDTHKVENFRACSYQRYQGVKLAFRFNAFSYWYLTKAMDSHNVGRGRGSVEDALKLIKAKTLIVAVDSDIMFPVVEHEYMHKHIAGSRLEIIDSLYGHDGFLIETKKLTDVLKKHFFNEKI